MLQSAQAGSTTDIDNLRVVDLDTGEVVYSNSFSETSQATNNLQLFHFPQGGANTNDFVVNGPMTRVVDGKLRLETTGFGANGSGGYESHSEAEYTEPLPHNFLVEFDAVRLQWAGHFHFHISYRDPTDPPSSHELFGAYTTNRAAPFRLDWLRMASSGSWFQQYGLHSDAATTNSSWPISFSPPPGSLQQNHKLGISLSNNIASFYLDGQLLNSAPIDDYLGPSGDFDGDGVNDYREGKDGTDPNDAASFEPLSKGLLAYFPLDGNASDESGLANNLTIRGATGYVNDRFANSGSALSFNEDVPGLQAVGSGANVRGSSMTVAFWYRKVSEPIGDWAFYIGSEGGSGKSVVVALDYPSDVRFSFFYNDLDYGASPSQVAERWYHLIGTYDVTTGLRRLFINGVLVASDTPPEGFSGNDFFAFGKRGTEMDDVRIYNRALAPMEAARLYTVEADNLDSDADGLTDAWEAGFGRYQVVRGNFTWDQAKADAQTKGGHLATVTSAAENSFIAGLNNQLAWLGATDREQEGSWQWVTGELFSYANWYSGTDGQEPDNYSGQQHFLITHFNGNDVWGDERNDDPNIDAYILEFGYPTDPFNADTDGDGFNDKVESDADSDPNNAAAVPGFADSDGDGVTNYRETQDGTDPNDPASFSPLSKGLVAYYPLDGSAKDESGFGNDGTANGAIASQGRHGASSTAFFFDGVDDEIAIQPAHPLVGLAGEITVTAWIYNEGLGAPTYGSQDLQGIFGPATYLAYNLDGGFGLRLYDASHDSVNDRRYSLTVGAPRQDIYSASIAPENSWDFVVATYDGNTMNIYRNGSLDASEVVGPGLTGGMNYASNYFTIGQFVDWSAGTQRCPFHGKIDDVRVYSRALGASEVGSLYHTEAGNLDSDGDGLADAWERGFGRYSLIQGTFTWDQAKADAESKGGHLATITSEAERLFIMSQFPESVRSNVLPWLGASDAESEGEWRWVTGERWGFAYWSSGNPDNGGSAYPDQDYLWAGIAASNPDREQWFWDDYGNSGNPVYQSGYLLEFGYPTDPLDSDTDSDSLPDGAETGTGKFVSASDAGTSPLDPDTSGDGILDGESVAYGFDPNVDYTPVLDFLREKSGNGSGRFGLFTEASMMELNLGGVVLRKSGSTVNLRLKIQSKMDLRDSSWHDEGTETFILDMPSSKAFMRIRALGPQ